MCIVHSQGDNLKSHAQNICIFRRCFFINFHPFRRFCGYWWEGGFIIIRNYSNYINSYREVLKFVEKQRLMYFSLASLNFKFMQDFFRAISKLHRDLSVNKYFLLPNTPLIWAYYSRVSILMTQMFKLLMCDYFCELSNWLLAKNSKLDTRHNINFHKKIFIT